MHFWASFAEYALGTRDAFHLRPYVPYITHNCTLTLSGEWIIATTKNECLLRSWDEVPVGLTKASNDKADTVSYLKEATFSIHPGLQTWRRGCPLFHCNVHHLCWRQVMSQRWLVNPVSCTWGPIGRLSAIFKSCLHALEGKFAATSWQTVWEASTQQWGGQALAYCWLQKAILSTLWYCRKKWEDLWSSWDEWSKMNRVEVLLQLTCE